MHTLLDLRQYRGFTDSSRRFILHQAQAFSVIRGKSNLLFRHIYSRTLFAAWLPS